VAQDVYPLEKEEAIKRGWKWQDNLPFTMGKETTTWNSYEMKIEKVQEDILNEIFACECCKKNYRIIRSELKFYKQMKLPLSRLCSGCRHLERIKTRNPRNLHNRTCNKCNKEIQTTFAPERPEKVYCEECYLKEVY
jgi:CxxC-x17-CxxC domain-containing protein